MATCLITGCQLAVEGIEYYWGDLHEQGDQFIFYCIQKTPLARGYDSNTVKEVRLHHTDDRFERGGVWIFSRKYATLNKAAMEYITPSRPVAADCLSEEPNPAELAEEIRRRVDAWRMYLDRWGRNVTLLDREQQALHVIIDQLRDLASGPRAGAAPLSEVQNGKG